MSHPKEKLTLGSIAIALGILFLNTGTSWLYSVPVLLDGVTMTPENAIGAFSAIMITLVLMIITYSIFATQFDMHGVGGTTALASLIKHSAEKTKIPFMIAIGVGLGWFILNVSFPFLLTDSIVTALITGSSSAAVALTFDTMSLGMQTACFIAIFAGIILFLRWTQSLGTNTLGKVLSVIAFVRIVLSLTSGWLWNMTGASPLFLQFNLMAGIQFIIDHPLGLLFCVGGLFLVPTGLEMFYSDMSHVGRKNIMVVGLILVLTAIMIYSGEIAYVLHTFPGQVMESHQLTTIFFDMLSKLPLWVAPFASLVVILSAFGAIQSTNVGAYTLMQEATSNGIMPRISYLFPKGSASDQGWSPFVANLVLGIALIFGSAVIFFEPHGAVEFFDKMYGFPISVTMFTSCLGFIFVSVALWMQTKKVKHIVNLVRLVAVFLPIAIIFMIANGMKIETGAWKALVLALIPLCMIILHKIFERFRDRHFHEVSYDKIKKIAMSVDTRSNDKRVAIVTGLKNGMFEEYVIPTLKAELYKGHDVYFVTFEPSDEMFGSDRLSVKCVPICRENHNVFHYIIAHSPTMAIQAHLVLEVIDPSIVDIIGFTFGVKDYALVNPWMGFLLRLQSWIKRQAFHIKDRGVTHLVKVSIAGEFNPFVGKVDIK